MVTMHAPEPEIDAIIDKFLTTRDANEGKDPLDPGEFPSLGFPNEKRGSYFIQITNDEDTLMVSVWRQTNGFAISYYRSAVYNGVRSWGSKVVERSVAEDLLSVQAATHAFFTSGGNSAPYVG